MSAPFATVSSYLLIDAALADCSNWEALHSDGGSSWMAPLYAGTAAWVGPVLIDILAAEQTGALDQVMDIANAISPQLHLSFIDTSLSLGELSDHLRQFIAICNHEQKAFSLRFADCLVTAALPLVFNDVQWATFAGPLVRWCVHQRDGTLSKLSAPDLAISVGAPSQLTLTAEQINHLRDIFAPDRMIGHLRNLEHGKLPGSCVEQYQWASAAYALWLASGNEDEIVWRWVTEAVFETRGALLNNVGLSERLAVEKLDAVHEALQIAVVRSNST